MPLRPEICKTHQQKQAACSSPPPSRSAQSATPTARRQGEEEHSPLTVLVCVTSLAQRDGSGGSRQSMTRTISCPTFMGISNCRHG
jgi:hypothetical protein